MTELASRADLLFHLSSAAILFLATVVVLHRWPAVGTGLVIAAVLLTSALRQPALTAEVGVAGMVLTAFDVLALAVMGAAVVAAVADGVHGRGQLLVAVLAGLLLINVVRGVVGLGLQVAVNEARPWLYLVAGLLYALGRPVTRAGWWTAALAGAGVLLAALAVQGFATTGLTSVTARVQLNGQLIDPRPVTATGALVLVEGMLLVAAYRHGRRPIRLAMVVVLAATVVLLQHRTLWVACAVGLCYFGSSALRAGGRRRLAGLLGVGGAVAVVVVVGSGGLLQDSVLAQSAANATQADSTLTWRLLGWRELLADHFGPSTLLFGDPFGTGYARLIGGQVVTVSPHSQYVETFLRFGLVGSVVIIAVAVLAWRNADGPAYRFGVHPAAVRTLLVVVLTYGITYRWDAVQALLLGTMLAAGQVSAEDRPRRVQPAAVGAGRR